MNIKNKLIGAHVSISGGLDQAVKRASLLNATAFAFFTKNQRQWKSISLTSSSIDKFLTACEYYNYTSNQILPHSNYLINLGHPSKEKLEISRKSFIDEINRCMQLRLKMLNFHPGNHLQQINEKLCLSRISESINIALEKTIDVTVIIENTAGQGGEVGFRFEQLADIIYQVEDKSRIGICIDTCHAFVAGYDLSTEKSCTKVFKQFSNIIGFNYLRGVHLNDSKKECGSRIDRHHNIGKGLIGNTVFSWIMSNNKYFNGIPMILETINHDIWAQEIFWLKKMILKKN